MTELDCSILETPALVRAGSRTQPQQMWFLRTTAFSYVIPFTQSKDLLQNRWLQACGSELYPGLRAALTAADVALVPFRPRSFDLWTLDNAEFSRRRTGMSHCEAG